jgi:5-methylcytosine-specific restriction endonuclease McrA
MRIHHRHRARILRQWNNRCGLCKQEKHCEIHHKIRQKDGGSDKDDNLIPLCEDCHKITLSFRNKINLQNIKP